VDLQGSYACAGNTSERECVCARVIACMHACTHMRASDSAHDARTVARPPSSTPAPRWAMCVAAPSCRAPAPRPFSCDVTRWSCKTIGVRGSNTKTECCVRGVQEESAPTRRPADGPPRPLASALCQRDARTSARPASGTSSPVRCASATRALSPALLPARPLHGGRCVLALPRAGLRPLIPSLVMLLAGLARP